MSSAFLEALKAKQSPIAAPKPPAKPISPVKPDHSPLDPLEINVELILDRGRIDVFFSRKPEQEILDWLHRYGFSYRGADKAWYHKDTTGNRYLLNSKFNLEIEAKEEVPTPVIETEIDPGNASPEYIKFKTQVNELIAELKVDAADLMLLAIDNLHKVKFGRN